jgi:long-chain fatty acid transport protein
MKRALALVLVSSTAYAGGTQRPNGISARGVGMGGAWAAWADDATALYFNPGALDTIDPHVMIGAELVYGARRYRPLLSDGTYGPDQKTTLLAPVPSLGVVGRFTDDDDRPSRFTLALGVWNTFGGRISYPKTGMPALDTTQDFCIEVNGGVAFHVSERLSVGATARLGIGLFQIVSTMNPFDADLSASGIGGGLAVGALFRPTDTLRIGVNWRSPMRITTTGRGTVVTGGQPEPHEVEHGQDWPQHASVGIGLQASPQLRLATQVDWNQWSQLDAIEVRFPNGGLPNQAYPAYWEDNFAVRLGAAYAFSDAFALRGGGYYDTPAVPDATLERQYSDAHKFGVSVGAGLHAGSWRFDTAVDGIIPRTRSVPNNAQDVTGVGALRNKAPGDYRGMLVTFELAASRTF